MPKTSGYPALMDETPDEETARLLAPYIVARNEAAHECLSALLDGRHAEAIDLLATYQVTAMAVDGAMTVCGWFDDGVADQHITVEHTNDVGDPGAAS